MVMVVVVTTLFIFCFFSYFSSIDSNFLVVFLFLKTAA